MDKISVEGIRLYAYHGCLDEEGKIGTEYSVDVEVWGEVQAAIDSDELSHTMDYVTINRVVADRMAIRHKLIETVADQILGDIFKEMPLVQKAKIKLSKLHPPINGDVKRVSIELKRKRKHYLPQ
jgi:dihydroneopterin aldolase|tara:strand:- start:77 stop:451 length:375 start_codon:yes stop_codon:yes gene_type:complete